jgi:hypothetical protein
MGSVMDSRYWVCPSCFRQFDWEAPTNSPNNPNNHDEKECEKKEQEESKVLQNP